MARVLWLGDAGCTTGFGTVTHAIGDRLVDTYGHDIHVLAVNYKGDHWPTKLKLYVPTIRDQRDVRGKARIVEMLGKVMPEIVVSLNDPLVLANLLLDNGKDKDLYLARFAPILAYTPIDGVNYPPLISALPSLIGKLPALSGGMTPQPTVIPVAMSNHGSTVLGGVPVIHHGVDTETFRPVKERPYLSSTGEVVSSKADAKRSLGIPDDAILAVRVDRNSLRKNFADTIAALVPVMRVEPKLHAWLHCKWDDAAGVDLNLFLSRYPDVAERFHGPKQFDTNDGWTLEDLGIVYNAGDLFVSTSSGEGFGLTLAEAAACELPIIALNVSAIPEVVGPGGILLDPERTIVPLSGQDNWLPNVAAFSDAIHQLVRSAGARRELGKKGRAHVTASFSWDEAAKRFHELITGVVQKASGSTTPGGAT